MLNICRIPFARLLSTSDFFIPSRLYRTSVVCFNESSNKQQAVVSNSNWEQFNSEEVNKRLMDFFDAPENWGKSHVKSGRSWRMDELRIKSNQDLHKLWYILFKERNMLMTMIEAAAVAKEAAVSPERVEKVEESMKNIEEVVKERNKAYWDLEVGDSQYVSRRRVFRQDMFGRWRWMACSEHLIPYWMNTKWRQLYGPGFGKHVDKFTRKMREQKENSIVVQTFKESFHCRQLIKRFKDIDLDYLQELYPNVNVKFIKDNLKEYEVQGRTCRFHALYYSKYAKKESIESV